MLERIVEHHDGNLVKSESDGHMIAFSSAHAGLRCAIELQRTFAGRSLTALGAPLAIRSGLHTGFVIVNADDFLGRNVVLAARIADRAAGRGDPDLGGAAGVHGDGPDLSRRRSAASSTSRGCWASTRSTPSTGLTDGGDGQPG